MANEALSSIDNTLHGETLTINSKSRIIDSPRSGSLFRLPGCHRSGFWLVLLGIVINFASITAVQAAPVLSSLEMFFEANTGQSEAPASYLARGQNYHFLIAPTQASLVLRRTDLPAFVSPREFHSSGIGHSVLARSIKMQFAGANPEARISGDSPLAGKINYLIGNDPAQWRTDVPTFGKVRVHELYPGIDLVYYGNQQQLEYDFNVAPNARPDDILIRFRGVENLSLNPQGELVLTLGSEEIRQPRPSIYQYVDGKRKTIRGGYRLQSEQSVGFELDDYNPSLPLIIDPVLGYSSFLGGSTSDIADTIRFDTNNNAIYLAGITLSTRFSFSNSIPAGGFPGAYTNTFQGGTINGDGFIARLMTSGTNLILDYFTYLGGTLNDGIYDMALAPDGSGNVYVTGFTDSTNFPVRPFGSGVRGLPSHINGALDPSLSVFPVDAFIAQISAGSNLVYSTYLGGSDADIADSIAVDSQGNAYVSGYTFSTNFTTTNAFQTRIGSPNNSDAFLAVVSPDPAGPYLLYSTYLGGTNADEAEGVAVDAAGFVYVAGYTASTNFPITTDALQNQLNRSTNAAIQYRKVTIPPLDGFLAKFDPRVAGVNSLLYSTYLGGTNNDGANRLTADSASNVYVVGYSESGDFPNTATNIIRHGNFGTNARNADAFLAKINFAAAPPANIYSVLFGGTNVDSGWAVAVNPVGEAFVVGTTFATNFPVTTNIIGPLVTTNTLLNNVFVTAFNTDASALLYSLVLGGSGDDYGFGIAVDAINNAYLTGRTLSTNFPTTLDAFALPLQRTNNAFIAVITGEPSLTETLSGDNLLLQWPASPTFLPQYRLQVKPDLGASDNWTPFPSAPTLLNGQNTVPVPITNGFGLFRLIH